MTVVEIPSSQSLLLWWGGGLNRFDPDTETFTEKILGS